MFSTYVRSQCFLSSQEVGTSWVCMLTGRTKPHTTRFQPATSTKVELNNYISLKKYYKEGK